MAARVRAGVLGLRSFLYGLGSHSHPSHRSSTDVDATDVVPYVGTKNNARLRWRRWAWWVGPNGFVELAKEKARLEREGPGKGKEAGGLGD